MLLLCTTASIRCNLPMSVTVVSSRIIRCTHILQAYTARIHCTHTLHAYTARIHCTRTNSLVTPLASIGSRARLLLLVFGLVLEVVLVLVTVAVAVAMLRCRIRCSCCGYVIGCTTRCTRVIERRLRHGQLLNIADAVASSTCAASCIVRADNACIIVCNRVVLSCRYNTRFQ